MDKEKIIELFNSLSLEDQMEVLKTIMPEFCQSMRKEPQRMQEMMKSMMVFGGSGMWSWMGKRWS